MKLTNEQRLAVVKEVWAFNYAAGGYCDGYTALDAYERSVRDGERS